MVADTWQLFVLLRSWSDVKAQHPHEPCLAPYWVGLWHYFGDWQLASAGTVVRLCLGAVHAVLGRSARRSSRACRSHRLQVCLQRVRGVLT